MAHLRSYGTIANLIEAPFQPSFSLLWQDHPLLRIILGAFHFSLKLDRPWLPKPEALYSFLFLTLSLVGIVFSLLIDGLVCICICGNWKLQLAWERLHSSHASLKFSPFFLPPAHSSPRFFAFEALSLYTLGDHE